MDHREKLLKLVQEKGPLLPSQINKELNTNVLFASAMLSEMVDTKKLRLTTLKIGGSPLYYHPGQEEKLQEFSNKLVEKDKRTFDLLRKKEVLRDKDQEPLVRVSLREIKDFAIPLQVTVNDRKELFWKYYMVEDDSAEKIIKEYLEKNNYLEPKKQEKKVEKQIQKEEPKTKEKEGERRKEAQMTIADLGRKEAEILREEKKELKQEDNIQVPETETRETEETTKIKPDIKMPEETETQYSYSFSFSPGEKETKKAEKEEKNEEKEEEPELPTDDEFYNKIQTFFDEGGIVVEDFNLVRKGTEYDFTIMIPSPVGPLKYFCKAKSKKKLNDGDVSAAFVAGQMKGLPVLMVTLGEMTTKAAEMIEKDFKSFVIKKLE